MKKAIVFLIIALFISPLLLCVTKAQAAADWKQYHQNRFMTLFYDANSIKRSGDVVQVTILGKNTPAGTDLINPEQKIDYFFIFAEINCRDKTYFQKRIVLYTADGSLVDDIPYDEPGLAVNQPWPVSPACMEDSLYHITCGC